MAGKNYIETLAATLDQEAKVELIASYVQALDVLHASGSGSKLPASMQMDRFKPLSSFIEPAAS